MQLSFELLPGSYQWRLAATSEERADHSGVGAMGRSGQVFLLKIRYGFTPQGLVTRPTISSRECWKMPLSSRVDSPDDRSQSAADWRARTKD